MFNPGDVLKLESTSKYTNKTRYKYFLYLGELDTYKFSPTTLQKSNYGKFHVICKLNKSHLTCKKQENVFFKTNETDFFKRIKFNKKMSGYEFEFNMNSKFSNGFDLDKFKARIALESRQRLVEVVDRMGSNLGIYRKEAASLLSLYNINSYPNLRTFEDFTNLL